MTNHSTVGTKHLLWATQRAKFVAKEGILSDRCFCPSTQMTILKGAASATKRGSLVKAEHLAKLGRLQSWRLSIFILEAEELLMIRVRRAGAFTPIAITSESESTP